MAAMIVFIVSLQLLALPALATNNEVEKRCPPRAVQNIGAEYFQILNGTCYSFLTLLSETYVRAKAACHNFGGDLAMPKTKPINDFLLEQMDKFGQYHPMWIGMNDLQEEGRWVWEDGSIVKPWGNTAPLMGKVPFRNEDCGALDPRDRKWHDYKCKGGNILGFFYSLSRLPFICQYPATDVGEDEQGVEDAGSNSEN